VSTDIHHFYIDSEIISASLDESARKKPIYLQLRQKSSDRVHIELFMSNGEYPTPGKHKFSCNTKDSASVNIKLPAFTQPAHWLIRVQPSEPMSVWSKSLEYSLRLYESMYDLFVSECSCFIPVSNGGGNFFCFILLID
jgi:hypothetical protein